MECRITIARRGIPAPQSRSAFASTMLLVGASILLSACSTLFDGKFDFRDGWRRGKVERIVGGDAVPRPWFWRCTRRSPSQELAGHRYVILTYDEVPYRVRRHLVALPPELDLHPGQSVYVNAFACQDAIAIPQDPPHAKPDAVRG